MEAKYQIKYVVVQVDDATQNLLSFDDPQIAMDVCQQYKERFRFSWPDTEFRVEVQFA